MADPFPRKQQVLLLTLALVVLPAGALMLRGRTPIPTLPDGRVRLAILSDTHIAGPEYALNGENGPLDNESITRTQQRLFRVVEALNAVSPVPQLALFGGDIVHNGLERLRGLGLNSSGLAKLFAEPVNAYTIAEGILKQLHMEKLYAWGNHDKLLQCGDAASSASRKLSAQLLRHYFHAAGSEYSSRDLGPHWKVVALNSMLGYTWDPADPRCNGMLSSFGEEQLRWLDSQLAEGKHTLIIMHFPLPSSSLNEVPDKAGLHDLRTVLTSHDNVRLVLNGHCHKGIDWQDLYPFPAFTVPATRYSPQNFRILDLHPNGSFDSVDIDKNRNGSRCSDWWSYQDSAKFVAKKQPRDAGDCGSPAEGEEETFPLPPILSPSDIPSQDVFNPERSCQFVLARQFLEACAAGASQSCCDVVADQFRLSSSAPFSACFCQPSFWRQAVKHVQQQQGVDLASVLHSCVADKGQLIVFPGGPWTWCPTATLQGPAALGADGWGSEMGLRSNFILVCQAAALFQTFCTAWWSATWYWPIAIVSAVLRKILPSQCDGCARFYEGVVTHSRKQPKQHRFSYEVRMAVVDLDNSPSWWKRDKTDNMTSAEARRLAGTTGPVRLLTHPTSAGYTQNPISVYYCYSADGSQLEQCIAEVTNTPWAERVTFLFRPGGETVPKALHVSPLMDMRSTWRIKATDPRERLFLSVGCSHPELGDFFLASFDARLSSQPHLPNETASLGTLWRYGFQPQRVALWIYWQAVLLLWKGVPFYGPPGPEFKAAAAAKAKNPKTADGRSFVWRAVQSWPWNAS